MKLEVPERRELITQKTFQMLDLSPFIFFFFLHKSTLPHPCSSQHNPRSLDLWHCMLCTVLPSHFSFGGRWLLPWPLTDLGNQLLSDPCLRAQNLVLKCLLHPPWQQVGRLHHFFDSLVKAAIQVITTAVWQTSLQPHRTLARIHRVGEAKPFYLRVARKKDHSQTLLTFSFFILNLLHSLSFFSPSSHVILQLLYSNRIFYAVQEAKQSHSIFSNE